LPSERIGWNFQALILCSLGGHKNEHLALEKTKKKESIQKKQIVPQSLIYSKVQDKK
jgi:hypothetical protein